MRGSTWVNPNKVSDNPKFHMVTIVVAYPEKEEIKKLGEISSEPGTKGSGYT